MNEKIFSMLTSCGLKKNPMWWQAQTFTQSIFFKGINDALNFAVKQCALTASSSWLPLSAVVLLVVYAVNHMYCQTIESIIAIIMIERHSIMFFFIVLSSIHCLHLHKRPVFNGFPCMCSIYEYRMCVYASFFLTLFLITPFNSHFIYIHLFTLCW